MTAPIAPDELTARHHDEEAAQHAEESIRGRPVELTGSQRGLFGELIRDRLAFAAMSFLTLLVVLAVIGPWVAPYGRVEGGLSQASQSPVWNGGTWDHILGTDPAGYDILSRLIYGSRTSLVIGVAVVAVAGTFGVLMGLLAGYRGGRTDRFIMSWVDIQVAFPGLLMAMLILSLFRGSIWTITVALSINGWMVYARMTRGVVLSIKERPFVEAAEIIGAKPARVVFRHILPNLVTSLATLATLEFARIVLAEAALSFLGLGIQFPDVSWGLDAARGGEYINANPWYVIYPGLALTLTVLSINLLASWLRVAFDPQEREKRHAARVPTADVRSGA